LKYLNKKGIQAVFHYLTLHDSPFYKDKHDGRELPLAKHYSECIIRLPFFFELREEQIDQIAGEINRFYRL
jgi:dTDP-4-amino-4,6-dideoxygalactose transaminase